MAAAPYRGRGFFLCSGDLNRCYGLHMDELKLSIELIPEKNWHNTVRAVVSKQTWDRIKRQTFKRAKYQCEICGGQGSQWPVECHEIWSFTTDGRQVLQGMIALCPACHGVKHFGYSISQGRETWVMRHLMEINGLSRTQAESYVAQSFQIWRERSAQSWKVEMPWLDQHGFPYRSGGPVEAAQKLR